MLWAQFQPKNDAEAVGFAIGITIAGLISGGIPFFTGLVMRQTTLAVVGGVISAGVGALLGCCGGIPVAIIFTVIIVMVAQTAVPRAVPSPFERPLSEDYDDYARPFQVPDRKGDRGAVPYAEEVRGGETERRREPDRRREADDDWRRRAEDRAVRRTMTG
jgi:hypothetical protein